MGMDQGIYNITTFFKLQDENRDLKKNIAEMRIEIKRMTGAMQRLLGKIKN